MLARAKSSFFMTWKKSKSLSEKNRDAAIENLEPISPILRHLLC